VSDSFSGFIAASPVHLCSPSKVSRLGKQPVHPISRAPSSCIANRWFVEFTTYPLASRLRASWMEARVTKVAKGSARFSKSLARRRFRPNQEEGTLDHPAARQDDEAPHVVAPPDNLHARAAAPLPPHLQLATRCSRHRPRSVRATGSAGGSCRGLERHSQMCLARRELRRRWLDDDALRNAGRAQRRRVGRFPRCHARERLRHPMMRRIQGRDQWRCIPGSR
jgi:hypothetical protein